MDGYHTLVSWPMYAKYTGLQSVRKIPIERLIIRMKTEAKKVDEERLTQEL